jgi:hypothetical protein
LCAYFGGSEEAVDIFEFKRDVKVWVAWRRELEGEGGKFEVSSKSGHDLVMTRTFWKGNHVKGASFTRPVSSQWRYLISWPDPRADSLIVEVSKRNLRIFRK